MRSDEHRDRIRVFVPTLVVPFSPALFATLSLRISLQALSAFFTLPSLFTILFYLSALAVLVTHASFLPLIGRFPLALLAFAFRDCTLCRVVIIVVGES
jgi:hypothetical protein